MNANLNAIMNANMNANLNANTIIREISTMIDRKNAKKGLEIKS